MLVEGPTASSLIRLTLFITALFLANCRDEFEPVDRDDLTFPADKCVRTCSSNDDCPAGLLCAALPASEASSAWPAVSGTAPKCFAAPRDASEDFCQLPRGRSRRDLLLGEFRVSGFHILRADDEETGVAAFRLDAVPGAKFVHCALFACEPSIRESGHYGDQTTYEIANAERCVLAHDVVSGSGGLFDLGNPDLALTDEAFKGFPATLYAGCWAYNDVAIIAATSLEPVALGEVANYRKVRDDVCAQQGRPCVRDDGSTGVCGPKPTFACLEPCISSSDCTVELFAPVEEEPELPSGAISSDDGAGGSSDAPPAAASDQQAHCVWRDKDYVGHCQIETN